MYKIKFGEHTLHIVQDICSISFEDIGKNKAVIYKYTKPRKLKDIVFTLSLSPIKNHFIIHKDTEKVFKEVSKNFINIQAGGGLVINEKEQILFIYRNGKWDLPKGKIEAGETIELGAVREVEEECGIKVSRLKRMLTTTYHTYIFEEKNILKSNFWYLMSADSNQVLLPQIEENIERAEWVNKNNVMKYLENSYESISDLIIDYLTEK